MRGDNPSRCGKRFAPREFAGDDEMQARDIMTASPTCVTPDTILGEAARLMEERNVGMLPVVDAGQSTKLIGVVTDRDITLRHVGAGHTSDSCRVSEAMTDRVTTCRPDDDVRDVMNVMAREQIRRIPITNEDGALVGIVSQADIVLHSEDANAAEKTIEHISQP
jgi:CBS domain-containing protein